MYYNYKRWYDTYPALSNSIEFLKGLKETELEMVMSHVIKIILQKEPDLLDKNVLEFEMQNRWYDQDPYLWLIINSLRFADKTLINDIVGYLQSDNCRKSICC